MEAGNPDDAAQQRLAEADEGRGVHVLALPPEVVTLRHPDGDEHLLAPAKRQPGQGVNCTTVL